MPTTHVITGATGLIGAALVLALAEQRAEPDGDTADTFVCLVRPGRQPPTDRLHQVLRHAATAYATPPTALAAALRRSHAVPADLTTDLSRTVLPMPGRSGQVEYWHNAARMLFHEHGRRPSFATNVAGTRRVLDLARRSGATVFNYVSTAYVAGHAQGTVREEAVVVPLPRNPYERSKIAAERLARAAAASGDFAVRLLRPGVVVGDSATLRYPGASNGAYTLQQLIAAYYRGQSTHPRSAEPRRIRAHADEPFNLVPIDHVVRQAVALSDRGDTATGVFHLTNPTPPTTGDLLRALVANAGGPEPLLVPTEVPTDALADEEFTWRDRQLEAALGVYVPYLNNPQHFDRTRVEAALDGAAEFAWSPDHATLRALFRPYATPRPRQSTEPAERGMPA